MAVKKAYHKSETGNGKTNVYLKMDLPTQVNFEMTDFDVLLTLRKENRYFQRLFRR